MSELQQYTALGKQIVLNEYDWVYKLWNWADANMPDDTELPRDKNKLLNLKSFKLTSEIDKETTADTKKTAYELKAEADKMIDRLLIIMLRFESYTNTSDISKYISDITYLPQEIGNLYNCKFHSHVSTCFTLMFPPIS